MASISIQIDYSNTNSEHAVQFETDGPVRIGDRPVFIVNIFKLGSKNNNLAEHCENKISYCMSCH